MECAVLLEELLKLRDPAQERGENSLTTGRSPREVYFAREVVSEVDKYVNYDLTSFLDGTAQSWVRYKLSLIYIPRHTGRLKSAHPTLRFAGAAIRA